MKRHYQENQDGLPESAMVKLPVGRKEPVRVRRIHVPGVPDGMEARIEELIGELEGLDPDKRKKRRAEIYEKEPGLREAVAAWADAKLARIKERSDAGRRVSEIASGIELQMWRAVGDMGAQLSERVKRLTQGGAANRQDGGHPSDHPGASGGAHGVNHGSQHGANQVRHVARHKKSA